MALEQRIETLKKRHTEIDYQVRSEEARPFPDAIRLHHLKHQKLNLKDEIARLTEGHHQQAA
jgi:hypothetical protein